MLFSSNHHRILIMLTTCRPYTIRPSSVDINTGSRTAGIVVGAEGSFELFLARNHHKCYELCKLLPDLCSELAFKQNNRFTREIVLY